MFRLFSIFATSILFVLSVSSFFTACGGDNGTCIKDSDCKQSGQICQDQACVNKPPTRTPPVRRRPPPRLSDCQDGHQRKCFPGDAKLVGVGICKAGNQVCKDGSWEACKGYVPPKRETCDKLDNNCDGKVDENGICGSCKPGQTKDCYDGPAGTKDKGICKGGKQTCTSQRAWGPCEKTTTPQKEVCNKKDDDCDGKTDEDGVCGSCEPGKTQKCYSGPAGTEGKGECKPGTQTCTKDRKWGKCEKDTTPKAETCNQKDDDCDGKTDEDGICGSCTPGKTQSCYGGPKGTEGKGICKTGTQTCTSAKKWGPCQGAVAPQEETCNGKDDDCNGQTDEGLKAPSCFQTLGACAGLKQKCGGTKGWLKCEDADYKKNNAAYQPIETMCDGKDNDCDGKVDENVQKACYSGSTGCKPSGNNYQCNAPCRAGLQVCQSGKWSACQGQVGPQKELCNAKDDDCDGQTDNGNPGGGASCAVSGQKGACAKGTNQCQAGKVICKQTVTPKRENCTNKIDDDCNGKVDDCGVCTDGQKRPCYSGKSGCTKGSSGTYTCSGSCKAGTQTCRNGAWAPCAGESLPKQELCNWADEDCDGKIDEDGACFYSKWQNVSLPSGSQKVAYINPKVGIAIGTSSRIWRTTNGGSSWSSVSSGTSAPLQNLAVHPDGLVIIVGDAGTVLRSSDSGSKFAKMRTPITNNLYGVSISGDKYIFAVGANESVILSSDLGNTWQNLSRSGSKALHSLTFVSTFSSSTVLAVGDGGLILRSTNRGSNWTQISNGTTGNPKLNSITWSNGIGLIVGEKGTVLRSTNSGSSWTPIKSISASANLQKVLSPGKDIFLVKASTKFYMSTDGGQNFVSRSFGSSSSANDLTLRSPTALLAVRSGGGNLGEGSVKFISKQSSFTMRGVSFDNSSTSGSYALAVGSSGKLYRSTNSGVTWFPVAVPTGKTLYAVSHSGSYALAVGSSGTIIRSTDSGISWKIVSSGSTNTLRGVSIYSTFSGGVAFAVGDRGTLLRSTNNGSTWSSQTAPSPPFSSSILYGVQVKGTVAIAVGSNGWVIRTINAGLTWSKASTTSVIGSTSRALYAVSLYGISPYPAIAVGTSGTVIYSKNGGLTWSKGTVPSGTSTLNGVSIAYSSSAIAVGSSGTVLSTSNTGQSWTKIPGFPRINFYGASRQFTSSNHLVTSSYGGIFRTSDRAGKIGSWTVPKQPVLQLDRVEATGSSTFVALSSRGVIVRSTNKGSSWQPVVLPTQNYLYGLAKDSSTNMIAVGSSGTIIRSTSSGSSWSSVTAPSTVSTRTFYGATSPSSGTFVVVGSTGTILYSSNRGGSFSVRNSSGSTLRDVSCLSSLCLAAGSSGATYRSTNGGSSWTRSGTTTTSMTIYGIAVSSSKDAVAVGTSGRIYYTDNGGTSWKAGSSPTKSTLYLVRSLGSGRYLATDSSGLVIASADNGKTWFHYAPPMGAAIRGFGNQSSGGMFVGSNFLHALFQP